MICLTQSWELACWKTILLSNENVFVSVQQLNRYVNYLLLKIQNRNTTIFFCRYFACQSYFQYLLNMLTLTSIYKIVRKFLDTRFTICFFSRLSRILIDVQSRFTVSNSLFWLFSSLGNEKFLFKGHWSCTAMDLILVYIDRYRNFTPPLRKTFITVDSRSRHRKIQSFHVMNKINISVQVLCLRVSVPLTINDITISYLIGS